MNAHIENALQDCLEYIINNYQYIKQITNNNPPKYHFICKYVQYKKNHTEEYISDSFIGVVMKYASFPDVKIQSIHCKEICTTINADDIPEFIIKTNTLYNIYDHNGINYIPEDISEGLDMSLKQDLVDTTKTIPLFLLSILIGKI